MTFCGSGGRICWRCVAWNAAILVDLGIAERAKAGRSCWTNGEDGFMVELAAVVNMRWAAMGAWQACRRRPGRTIEAIAAVRILSTGSGEV
jgi:hypothetical protein